MDIETLLATIVPQMTQLVRTCLEAAPTDPTLYDVEAQTQRLMGQLGHCLLTQWVQAQGSGLDGPARSCECGGQQIYQHQHHPCTIMSSVGAIPVAQRASYRCPHCGTTTYPLDGRLGLGASGRISRYLQEQLAWLVAMGPITQAQQTLTRFGWPELSSSQVWTHSQALGAEVVAYQTQQETAALSDSGAVAPSHPLRQAIDAERAYVEVDGGRFCTRERDPQSGACVWKELKVAVIAAGVPDRADVPLSPVRAALAATVLPASLPPADRLAELTYVTHTGAWDTFGPRVWSEAWQRGATRTFAEVVVVADGADPIDTLTTTHLAQPGVQVTRILDLRHAQEHVWAVGRLAYGDRVLAWVQDPLRWLVEGQVDLLCQTLQPLLADARAEVAHAARKAIAYFQQHYRHIDYPTFVAKGLQIGSGAVESACKRFGTDRLKGVGMRWSITGATRVATLRSFVLSDRWDEVAALCRKRAA